MCDGGVVCAFCVVLGFFVRRSPRVVSVRPRAFVLPDGLSFCFVKKKQKDDLGAAPLRTRKGLWLGLVVGGSVVCSGNLLRVWIVCGATVLSFECAQKLPA